MASPWALPEQLRLRLQLATIDEAQAADTIAGAEAIIRAALNQTIDQVIGDELVLVGNGRRLLNLPEMPVTAVASVTVGGAILVNGTDYRWNRYGNLTRLGYDACWPLDEDVEVVCTHGYLVTPDAITQVCLQLAARAWVAPKEAVAAESLGDYSVTYDKQRTGQALTDFEMGMLERYAIGPASR
ncbi:hypothetical protein [Streptomyces sp. NPDC002666]